MHKRVKPIKEMLDEKILHIQQSVDKDFISAVNQFGSNPLPRERISKSTQTANVKIEEDGGGYHNFIKSDEVSENEETKYNLAIKNKIDDIQVFTKPQQPKRVNIQLNLVNFGNKESKDDTEDAVQRVAKKVLKSQ